MLDRIGLGDFVEVGGNLGADKGAMLQPGDKAARIEVCEKERERERECVCVCVCDCVNGWVRVVECGYSSSSLRNRTGATCILQ